MSVDNQPITVQGVPQQPHCVYAILSDVPRPLLRSLSLGFHSGLALTGPSCFPYVTCLHALPRSLTPCLTGSLLPGWGETLCCKNIALINLMLPISRSWFYGPYCTDGKTEAIRADLTSPMFPRRGKSLPAHCSMVHWSRSERGSHHKASTPS